MKFSDVDNAASEIDAKFLYIFLSLVPLALSKIVQSGSAFSFCLLMWEKENHFVNRSLTTVTTLECLEV